MALAGPEAMAALRARHGRRHLARVGALATCLLALWGLSLAIGQSYTPLGDVARVLLGQDVPGASFAVGTLRLPRSALSVLCGLSFGLGGVAFQLMLRNPLASPDIIGISSGASAAAVFAIVVLSLDGMAVSLVAVASGLGVAALIYALAAKGGAASTRLILVGIGIAAMMESFTAYVLSRATSWNLQEAMRWLAGSVNGARPDQVWPVAGALILFGCVLLAKARDLEGLRLGDETARAIGVDVARTRFTVTVAAVGLIAVATATAGPVAFVAFLSGPIAARIVGPGGRLLIPSALTGAVIVLASDYAGQFLLADRYPVGVVTGALGAPFLLYLIVRANRRGGAL